MSIRQTFSKGERLKSHLVLSRLFSEGQSLKQYPLRLIWMPLETPLSLSPIQFALTVPKRKFRKATQRNPIRRRIREAYRLNKHQCYEQLRAGEPQYAFIILYMAREELPYATIDKAMQKLLGKWLKNRETTF